MRKDYAYLFERVFYFLNGLEDEPMGYLVFDEIDRSACHILLGQVSNYFVRTANGRTRARLIIPEPFFVHSDMTTLVQLADIVAYVVSWGVRLGGMNAPARAELAPLSEEVLNSGSPGVSRAGNGNPGLRSSKTCDPPAGREIEKGNAPVSGHKASERNIGISSRRVNVGAGE